MEPDTKRIILSVCAVVSDCVEADDSSSDSQSSSSSSRDEESDNYDTDVEEIYIAYQSSKMRGEPLVNEKLDGYVERVVAGYGDQEFRKHFRVLPRTFERILTVIGPGLKSNARTGRHPIPATKQLLIALWFMATPDSYRSVSVKFGVGKATAFRALRRVTYSLHCAAPQFIRWPRQEEAVRVINEFQAKSGFPSVIGAIDSTHIRIRAPKDDAASYVNRKGYYSINLQAVCDSRCLFTHCFSGHVGSVHDARVYRNSPIANYVQRHEEFFPNDSHLIGDSAYPLNEHLIVPFRDNGHLSQRQKNFNFCLSSTRMAIERAFGLLKVRFRSLLDCLPLTDTMKIPEFIIACCVLHNICIAADDVLPVAVLQGHAAAEPLPYINRNQGNVKRNRISEILPLQIRD